MTQHRNTSIQWHHRLALVRRGAGALLAEISSRVGRWESAEVEKCLKGSRLLTRTGPGGCGKTCCALRAAREVAARCKDGVCRVALEALPAGVPHPTPGRPGSDPCRNW